MSLGGFDHPLLNNELLLTTEQAHYSIPPAMGFRGEHRDLWIRKAESESDKAERLVTTSGLTAD